MMWIKQIPDNFHELVPFCYGSLMLWQNKNVYVMDNHLYDVFKWDNYIMTAYTLQSNWFHTNIFLTHKEENIGSSCGDKTFLLHEEAPLCMYFVTIFILLLCYL